MPIREARKDLKSTPIIKIERAKGASSKNLKASRREEIRNIRAELKEIEI